MKTALMVVVDLPATLTAQQLRRIIEDGITHAPLFLKQEKVEVSILWARPA